MNPLPHSSAAASPALRSFEAQWFAREADPLSALREKAMQRFLALGLPTLRDESWRYTNLRALGARSSSNHFAGVNGNDAGQINNLPDGPG